MSRHCHHGGRSPQDHHRPAVEIDGDARRSANELLLDAHRASPLLRGKMCQCKPTQYGHRARLDESSNLAAFERAAKTRVAARGDQCEVKAMAESRTDPETSDRNNCPSAVSVNRASDPDATSPRSLAARMSRWVAPA